MRQFAIILNLFLPIFCYGQLLTAPAAAPEDLVELLVGSDEIEISKINYKGGALAAGVFRHTLTFLFNEGIILSTGRIEDAIGPNNFPSRGRKMNELGSIRLSQIVGQQTYDAAILSFNFQAAFDSLTFTFLFASEEYPEYANKHVNDVFAFIVYDLETNKLTNLAVLPGTQIPITVNSINHEVNSQYYQPSNSWKHDNSLSGLLEEDTPRGRMAYTFQYDGFTVPISAGLKIVPERKYRFVIAIADAGDGYYDSAVLMKAKSFKTIKTKWFNQKPVLSNDFTTMLQDQQFDVDVQDGVVKAIANIQFETGKSVLKEETFSKLEVVLSILKSSPKTQVNIVGHTDNQGKPSYNLALSRLRAKKVMNYLKSGGINAVRLTQQGMGDTQPIASNDTEDGRFANRRVEFLFY